VDTLDFSPTVFVAVHIDMSVGHSQELAPGSFLALTVCHAIEDLVTPAALAPSAWLPWPKPAPGR